MYQDNIKGLAALRKLQKLTVTIAMTVTRIESRCLKISQRCKTHFKIMGARSVK